MHHDNYNCTQHLPFSSTNASFFVSSTSRKPLKPWRTPARTCIFPLSTTRGSHQQPHITKRSPSQQDELWDLSWFLSHMKKQYIETNPPKPKPHWEDDLPLPAAADALISSVDIYH